MIRKNQKSHLFFLGIFEGSQPIGRDVPVSSSASNQAMLSSFDVAELHLLVACITSTDGLTFTSARVLARALLRASGFDIWQHRSSRPWTWVPLRSRALVNPVTTTVRITVGKMCGLTGSRHFSCRASGPRRSLFLFSRSPSRGALICAGFPSLPCPRRDGHHTGKVSAPCACSSLFVLALGAGRELCTSHDPSVRERSCSHGSCIFKCPISP